MQTQVELPARKPRVYSWRDMLSPRRDPRDVLRAISNGTAGAVAGSKHASGASTPITIFGSAAVLQWVRADLGVTIATGVSVWADQSASPNSYTQATGANQPTRNATDATLNNLPTISFNGTTFSMASALVLPQSGTTPTCILSVLKFGTPTGGNMIVFSPGSNTVNAVWQDSGGSNIIAYNGASNTLAFSGSTWRRVRADFSNAAGDILKGGSSSVTGNAGNGAASGTGRTLSGYSGGAANVSLFEVVYLNAIPTGPQMTAYDAYVTSITAGACAV